MEKIEFKDFPITDTPIDADNLNLLQNNVENEIEAIDTVLENLENNVNSGWIPLTGTFTFVSYDSTTYTGVVNSNLDLTSYLSVGMKVKFTQNATVKYGFITAITSTQITLFMGTDYTLLNTVITNAFYSMLKAPYGFPLDHSKWTVRYTNIVNTEIANPTSGTIYNSGLSFSLPIGKWNLGWNGILAASRSAAGVCDVQGGISTSSESFSIEDFRAIYYVSNTTYIIARLQSLELVVDVASKTTYYFLLQTTNHGLSTIQYRNALGSLEAKAVCAYL